MKKSSVFISYPQKYAFFVKKLCTYLTDQEYNVWCDFEETGIGDSVVEYIQNTLYKITINPKRVMVVILDKNDFVKWQEEEIESINKHITFIIHDEALNDRDSMSELKSENFIFNLKKSGEMKWLKIIETAIRIYNISIEIRKKENDYMLYHQRGELYENIGLLINAVNDYHKADNLLEANPPLNKMVYKSLKSHYFNHWDDVHHELAELSRKYNK